MPTVLVTVGNKGEMPPSLRVTPIRVAAMTICRKRNAEHPKDDLNLTLRLLIQILLQI